MAVLPACTPLQRPEDSGFSVGQISATAAGSFSGTVTHPDGLPFEGANVTLSPSSRGTVTDAEGHFSFERVLPGEYRVVVHASGWGTSASDVNAVLADQLTEVTVALVPAENKGLVIVHATGPDGLPAVGMQVTGTDNVEVATATTNDIGIAKVFGLEGLVVSVEVSDPTGRLASSYLTDLTVPSVGNIQASVTLSGRPDASATVVGSAACAACHPAQMRAQGWSAHGNALSSVSGELASGFVQFEQVALGSAAATLVVSGGENAVSLVDSSGESRLYTVSGLIGGVERGAVPWTEIGGTAWPLPLAWTAPNPTQGGWPEAQGAWVAWQTETWFDANGRFLFADTATPASSASAETQCFACHATGFTLSAVGNDAVAMTASSGTGRWLEGDVGCERCHGPGSEHVAQPEIVNIVNPALLSVDRANEVCAQCHAAIKGGNDAPYAWDATHGLFEPGDTLSDVARSTYVSWSGGAAAVPGAQADELQTSVHGAGGWRALCTDCHDPHGGSLGGPLASLRENDQDNTSCLTCHISMTFQDDQVAVETHSGHPLYQPDTLPGPGRCVSCHMPATAARLHWNDVSAAGDTMSHQFVAIPPSETLADFDAVGATTLEPGHFVTNSCMECHTFNDWLFGGWFPGPVGDPTLRETHVDYDNAWTGMFP